MALSRRLLDYILYLSLLILAVWVIGKLLGIITSPTWVEYIPYAAALVGAGAFLEMVRRMAKDLKEVATKVDNIGSRVIRIEAKLEDKELKEIEGFKEEPVEVK